MGRTVQQRWFTLLLVAVTALLGVNRARGSAATQTGVPVEGYLQLPDRSILPTTKVVLEGGVHSCLTAQDGSFAFHNVEPGVYMLEALSTVYHFSQAKVKVESGGEVKVLEYKYAGAPKQDGTYPISLTAHTKWSYFERRTGPNLFGMLKNPMTLMMLVSMGMMVFLPKLMANVDPEQMKEMEERTKSGQGMPSFTDMLSKAYSEASQPVGGGGTRAAGGGAGGPGPRMSSSGSRKKKH